jgi:hypothetical protein
VGAHFISVVRKALSRSEEVRVLAGQLTVKEL